MAEIIVCGCGGTDHHLIFTKEHDPGEEPEIWLHYHLEKKSWLQRLKIGIKYIFGYQSRFGMYGELLINKENISKFEEIVTFIKN